MSPDEAKVQFDKTKEGLDSMLRDLRGKGLKWNQIAVALNKAGYKTITGKKWEGKNIPSYAITKGIVPRNNNTSRGTAGSTGVPQYSALNGLAKKPRVYKKKTQAISDAEIEEIMTSNLATPLKLKVVRVVALSNG